MRYWSLIILTVFFLHSCKGTAQGEQKKNQFEVQKTPEEWKSTLSDAEFNILRQAGTERPHSSELLHIDGDGVFVCAGCGNPLFKNKHQFNSGTGWPSFDRPIDKGIVLGTDMKLGYERNEVLCARCGGHLGHRFNDGPKATTGFRYCMNGVAMNFIRAEGDQTVDQLIERKEKGLKMK